MTPALPALTDEALDDLDDAPEAEVEATEEQIVDQATAARTIAELTQEIATLQRLEALAQEVRRRGTDRKWEELSSLAQSNPAMSDAQGHRRKLIIFTEHRDTLTYLAIGHRDYRLGGSVFVRQFPRQMEIVSPGGFPPGITLENFLWRQAPRSRRIAEVFAKCGLVERSGQGLNRMFEECIKESKPQPNFSGTDDYQVSVTLRGEVQDARFLRFLERVGQERFASFTTRDLLALDRVHRDQSMPEEVRLRLPFLMEQGVIERVGRGKYILSRQFYGFLGRKGVYTRKRGLDRETNKALLLKHIRDNHREGSQLQEFLEVLPALSRDQVQRLLRELKTDGLVHNGGRTKGARWYPGVAPQRIASENEQYSEKTQL